MAATLVKATLVKNAYLQKAGYFISAANALDNSGVQDVIEIDVEGMIRLMCKITVASAALTAFQIKGQFHPDDPTLLTLRSTSLHFTSPTGILYDASGDLTIQGVGSGWFCLDCCGLTKVRLAANTGTSATLACSGTML